MATKPNPRQLPANAQAPTPVAAKPQNATTSKDKFLQKFGVLSDAAVGGFFTHAREPHRVQRALREWAYVNNQPFHEWNALQGWLSYTDDPEAKPKVEKIIDPMTALKWIADLDGDGKKAKTGVFLIHWPHFYVEKIPAMMHCLKHYCREFTTDPFRRIVLLSPEGAKLPLEIEHDVVQLDLELPTREELRIIYNSVIGSLSNGSATAEMPYREEQVQKIVDIGAGMTETEFEVSISTAIIENRETWPRTPLEDFTKIISANKTAVVKKSDVLELMEPESMDNVGGLDGYKAWIGMRIKCFTKEARDFGVDTPKGVVAIGPPGTGKSLLAKATASPQALNLPLIKLDISKVFNSKVGESEARVRNALKQLEVIAPCVVLFDEVDKGLGGAHQGNNDSGVSQRVLGTILTFIQENKHPIFWVLTANRAHGLDPALLRRGRMDEVFSVMPPNAVERLAVLKIHLRKRKQDPELLTDLDLAVIASEGFVSAEIESAVSDAITVAFDQKVPVNGALIKQQMGTMKPISVAFKDDFDSMSEWASNNARPASLTAPKVADERVRTAPVNGATPPRRQLNLSVTEEGGAQ